MNPNPAQPPPNGNKADKPTGVGLKEIIQMECYEGNSSILEIYSESEQGQIFIQRGKIIHAVINELKGEPAFAKLLALPGGSFEMATFESPEECTIAAPWTLLLNPVLRATGGSGETATKPAAVAAKPGTVGVGAGSKAARIEETLICSPTGEIVYEAQCADAAGRAAWLQSVAHQAGELGEILPLGKFDRMDVSFASIRIVSRFRADSLVYMRTIQGDGGV